MKAEADMGGITVPYMEGGGKISDPAFTSARMEILQLCRFAIQEWVEFEKEALAKTIPDRVGI